MRPVFEHRLVDRLRLAQMVASVSGNARVQDLVMAAFDHIDSVDLHIAQVLHRGASRLGPAAKRRGFVEPLGAQPDASGVGFGEREGLSAFAGHERARGRNQCFPRRTAYGSSKDFLTTTESARDAPK